MQGMRTTSTDPITEAREKLNIASALEETRGVVEPSKQRLFDTMSAVLAHEQNGVQLYQTYSQQAGTPDLKETWQAFGEQTREHQRIAERVITVLGGDPAYRSPVAKEIDNIDKAMLNVQATGQEADLARLGNIMLAETLCDHHWKGVSLLAMEVKDPAEAKMLKDAARIVEPDEELHFQWNSVMYDRYLQKATTGM